MILLLHKKNCLNRFLLFAGALILFNCSNQESPGSVPRLVISPGHDEIDASLADLDVSVRMIKLETDTNCLVGYFSSIIYSDSVHIIVRSNKEILIFDGNGRFLSKISSLGKGPFEYATIAETFVDPVSRVIYIMDYNGLLMYDYQGGFIESIKFDSRPSGLFRRKNGESILSLSQLYRQSNRDMIIVLDSNYQEIRRFKSRNPEVLQKVQQNLFFAGNPHEFQGNLIYKEPFVDTLFIVTRDSLIPYWIIDQKGLGYGTTDGINTENSQKVYLEKIAPYGLYEVNNYFFIKYRLGLNEFYNVYDKVNNKFLFIKRFVEEDLRQNLNPGLTNKLIPQAPRFWPDYVNGSTMAELVKTEKLTDEQLNHFDLQLDDNPIVIIANFE